AEVGPSQLHLVGALRQDLSDRETIADLLQDKAGEYGQDLNLNTIAEFVHRVEETGIDEPKSVVIGAKRLVRIVRATCRSIRGAGVMASSLAHNYATPLAEASNPKCCKESMHQTSMIGITHVLR